MTGAAPPRGLPYGTRVLGLTGCTVAGGGRYGPVQQGVVQYHADPAAVWVPVLFADGVTRMFPVTELTVVDQYGNPPATVDTTVADAIAAAAAVPVPRTGDEQPASAAPPPRSPTRGRTAAARSGAV